MKEFRYKQDFLQIAFFIQENYLLDLGNKNYE